MQLVGLCYFCRSMNALIQIENASNGNRFDWFHIADRMTECSSSLKRDRRNFFFSSLQLNIEPLIGMNEEGRHREVEGNMDNEKEEERDRTDRWPLTLQLPDRFKMSI